MKITKDLLSIIEESHPAGPIYYHVEFKHGEDKYYSKSGYNKSTCQELIEQIDGLELTEKNVLVNEGNYRDASQHVPVIHTPSIKIIFNNETILSFYYPYDAAIVLLNEGDYDILALQVMKNRLLK